MVVAFSYFVSFQIANFDFLPVTGCKSAVFVTAMSGNEGGVVGLRGSSLACFTCEFQTHNCGHVVKLTASEEELVFEMPDFLVDFFAEKSFRSSTLSTTTRKEWTIKTMSLSKNSFELSVSQKQAFSTLEEILKSKLSNTGLVELDSPSSNPLCPKCSLQCLEQSSRQVPCFLKKMVFHCEGKCLFYELSVFNTQNINTAKERKRPCFTGR